MMEKAALEAILLPLEAAWDDLSPEQQMSISKEPLKGLSQEATTKGKIQGPDSAPLPGGRIARAYIYLHPMATGRTIPNKESDPADVKSPAN
jgi:hypothetical protein